MENQAGDRGEDHRALSRQIRRIQLQAFPREAQRGGRGRDQLRAATPHPDLCRLQVAEGA